MTLLEQIKLSQRITHSALDGALQSDIEAGVLDLKRVGICPYQTDDAGKYIAGADGNMLLRNDALIRKALELYSKGMQDFEQKGSVYMAAYEKLRDSMSLCGDYRE